GANTRPADPSRLRSWRPYVEDARAYLDGEKRESWIVAGHSLGAATALLASRGRNDVRDLRLVEPVIPPSWLAVAAATPLWRLTADRIPIVRQAARRRNGWPDRDAVLASYEAKPIFKAWAPGVLEDYLDDGLVGDETGARLACDPEWEAATFAAQGNDVWAAIRAAPAPLSVLAADHPSSTVSPAARARLEKLGAGMKLMAGVSHLAPMEKPAGIAAFLQG
ncbi:MAG: alpha/beta hydrolase, partial [Oricola sp.]|nr:alpha/beta hydrolase [Oricola sp.]